jgi:DNA-directed RNA polymerase subunit RPC12/RpoP
VDEQQQQQFEETEVQQAPVQVPDMTEDEAKMFVNVLLGTLAQKYQVPVAAIDWDGNSTRVKFQRIREGYKFIIGLKSLVDSKRNFITRVVHEFTHIKNDMEYVIDTCGHGAYHTDAFGDQARIFGLNTTWAKSAGFASKQELTPELIEALPAPYKTDIDLNILPKGSKVLYKPKPPKAKRVQGLNPAVCPHCGQAFQIKGNKVYQEAPTPAAVDIMA